MKKRAQENAARQNSVTVQPHHCGNGALDPTENVDSGSQNPGGTTDHSVEMQDNAVNDTGAAELSTSRPGGLVVSSSESVPTVSIADRASATDSGCATPSAQLTNPFSTDAPRFVADSAGRQWYLGTSSNWAFNRRVLSMAQEKLLDQPAPAQNTLFDGTMYDLGWDGQRDAAPPENLVLPSVDFAIYLINAVKFHCGQLFHIFDEATFMPQFTDFHGASPGLPRSRGLWFVHFLLILAFGKAFVARRKSDSRRPPGGEYFVHAMKLMPDITFLYKQPVQAVEVLCCQALYLHCLDFRSAAHNVVSLVLHSTRSMAKGVHRLVKLCG